MQKDFCNNIGYEPTLARLFDHPIGIGRAEQGNRLHWTHAQANSDKSRTPEIASRLTPSGAARVRPHGWFFSIAITTASANIQPTLPRNDVLLFATRLGFAIFAILRALPQDECVPAPQAACVVRHEIEVLRGSKIGGFRVWRFDFAQQLAALANQHRSPLARFGLHEMKYTNTAASGGGKAELVWRRAKAQQRSTPEEAYRLFAERAGGREKWKNRENRE